MTSAMIDLYLKLESAICQPREPSAILAPHRLSALHDSPSSDDPNHPSPSMHGLSNAMELLEGVLDRKPLALLLLPETV